MNNPSKNVLSDRTGSGAYTAEGKETRDEQSLSPLEQELLEALKGLFKGGFIESGTREYSQFAQELEERLKPCRAVIAKAENRQALSEDGKIMQKEAK
jgi:hypothetical protein